MLLKQKSEMRNPRINDLIRARYSAAVIRSRAKGRLVAAVVTDTVWKTYPNISRNSALRFSLQLLVPLFLFPNKIQYDTRAINALARNNSARAVGPTNS